MVTMGTVTAGAPHNTQASFTSTSAPALLAKFIGFPAIRTLQIRKDGPKCLILTFIYIYPFIFDIVYCTYIYIYMYVY